MALDIARAVPQGVLISPSAPLAYLHTYGPRADAATSLTWGLLWLSIAVVAIVTALVVLGVVLRGAGRGAIPEVAPGPAGLAWLTIGVGLTLAALIVSLVWTVAALARINSPAAKPAVAIEVTGHQWWWEVRYLATDPAQTFTTANEIHVPVGHPVLVRLRSADVIHSFWAPALMGKTDTIPGQVNVTWLQADRPGIYRGQCTEYCGLQHAHMGLEVIADTPAGFASWRQAQLRPAAALAGAGAAVFAAHCSSCHTVRGTGAGGIAGPDLTHLMSRRTIASALLPTDTAALQGWVANPQALKPGTKMPPTHLSGPELNAVTAYLATLK